MAAPRDPAETSPLGATVRPIRPAVRARWIARLEERGSYPRWVMAAALAGMFATSFPITILTISLGSIAAEFGVRETTMTWVITSPMLCSAVALPLLGKLGDLRGHRRVFLLGFSLSTLTAAMTALAWDAPSLIGVRTLSAVVGAATGPTSMALIFSVYAGGDRVKAMGWWAATGAAAPALGLIAGGPLVDWLGWRVVFVIQAAFALIALVLATAVLRETPRQRVRFDIAGVLTLTLAVGGIMFAIARLRDLSPTSPWLWGPALAGVVGLALFVRVEARTREPLLPLEFFTRRDFSAPILANAFMGAAYMGAFVLAPLILLGRFGLSISEAAAIMLLRTATLTLSSVAGGRLGTWIGLRNSVLTGSAVLTAGLLVIAYASLNTALVLFGLGLVLQGLGNGLALPALSSAVANSVPDRDLGIASAANRLTAQLGTAFGITLLSLSYGGTGTGESFARAFAVGAAFAAVSVASASFMERRRAPDA
jgi:MFS family permease